LGPILLKLRVLAARLESNFLGDWVKYESEGYPASRDVPDYRVLGVSYTGTFSGPYGTGIKNAPISPFLVEKHAGKRWARYEMRGSIAEIDDLLAGGAGNGELRIEAADLILMLQGKVYADYACNEVVGRISRSAVVGIRHVVRSRVLELTLELEKTVPEAREVTLGWANVPAQSSSIAATQIAQQIVYGNVMSITAGGGSNVVLSVVERDVASLQRFLSAAGIPEKEASELSQLAASESAESSSEPAGPRVRAWLAEYSKKAAAGVWGVGKEVATDLIKEALLRFYGLK
jgi:hypothetical protein